MGWTARRIQQQAVNSKKQTTKRSGQHEGDGNMEQTTRLRREQGVDSTKETAPWSRPQEGDCTKEWTARRRRQHGVGSKEKWQHGVDKEEVIATWSR